MKKPRKPKVNALAVEQQRVVHDVRIGSSKLVRMSRVKYEANDYTFVDIREFWRGWDDDGEEVFYPSKKGLQLKETDFLKLVDSFLSEAGRPLGRAVGDVH